MFVIAILTLAVGGLARIVWPTYKIYIEVAQVLTMVVLVGLVVNRQIAKYLEAKRLQLEQEEIRRQRRNERQRERRERIRALRNRTLEQRAELNSRPLQEMVSNLLQSSGQNPETRPQIRKTVPKMIVDKPAPPPPKSRLDRLLEADEDEVSRS